MDQYNYDLLNKPFYPVEKSYFKIDNFMKEIKKNYDDCKNINSSDCNIYNGIKIKKKNNYFFLIRKK